jgi:hypothetical protein
MKNIEQRGFTLLIAVIFMSVMLTFGLALGSLGYKQQVLASSVIQSQYAFYAADAALECALYADQQLNSFDYATHSGRPDLDPGPITCSGVPATELIYSANTDPIVVKQQMPLDDGRRCADVTIYKYSAPVGGITGAIFAQGYDVSCATVNNPNGARFVSRGIQVHY